MSPEAESAELVRLQKALAHAGVASRRQAEELILQGHVKVNGEVVQQLGTKVNPSTDVIELDGVVVQAEEQYEYYLLNKPPGYVTTVRDPQHRPTVVQLLRGVKTRVYPVGRLDLDSEGLLLMTNDGTLAHRLTHPRFGIEKEYSVELAAPIAPARLDRIRQGVDSLGEHLKPRTVETADGPGESSHLTVVLAEGKKREVRRMFEAVGSNVTRLVRTRFGPLSLDDLRPGKVRELKKEEIEQLRAATSG